jgi:hypothetical protein
MIGITRKKNTSRNGRDMIKNVGLLAFIQKNKDLRKCKKLPSNLENVEGIRKPE